MLQVVSRNWSEAVSTILRGAEHSVTLCAPYVHRWGTDFMLTALGRKAAALGPESLLLTDLSPKPMLQGATDPSAILQLMEAMVGIRVLHLPRVHAKVYISDGTRALVGSANMSRGGFQYNYEYGVAFEGPSVEHVRKDVLTYASLGSSLDVADMRFLAEAVRPLKGRLDRWTLEACTADDSDFAGGVEAIARTLAERRVPVSAPYSTFGHTIVYVLRRDGPLTTEEINDRIRSIHPDLCDDSVDRVIAGVHFGKLWKHTVRNSQQALKRKGVIRRDGDNWTLGA